MKAIGRPLHGRRRSPMEARERSATQEHRVAAKNQPYKIFEDGLFDRVAVEFQRYAIEPIDVDERHRDHAGLIVGMKRDRRR